MINFNVPDLLNSTRKRKVNSLIDPTTGYPYDTTIPNDLPVTNAMPIGSNIPQGGGKLEMLGRILQAAAAGASVGFSQDPAQALALQLSQAAKERLARQQMQAEKEAQQAQMQFQKEMQKSQQQYGTSEAQKERTFKKEQDVVNFNQDLAKQEKGFKQQKELQSIDQQARLNVLKLTQNFESDEALKNREFQTKQLELKQSGDLNGALARSVTGALMNSVAKGKMSMSAVVPIITKLNNGEALDKNDAAVLDHSIKSAARGTGVKGAVTPKILQGQQFKSEEAFLDDKRNLINKYVESQLQPHYNNFTGEKMPAPPVQEVLQQAQQLVDVYEQLTGHKQKVQNTQGSIEMQNLDRALSNPQIKPQELFDAIKNNPNMTPEQKQAAKQKLRNRYKGFKGLD